MNYRNVWQLLPFAFISALTSWSSIANVSTTVSDNSDVMTKVFAYQKNENIKFNLTEIAKNIFSFSYQSIDGEQVNGQISYPDKKAESYPIMIGAHAMGRSFPRWWTDNYKGNPTVTQVNKLTAIANDKGYVVIAIDARNHGSRKVKGKELSVVMTELKQGKTALYEAMIKDTVIDHRLLLDWIETQENLDQSNIRIAGYSMGAQVSLLLAGVDHRIKDVLAIVPPHIKNNLPQLSPVNIAPLLKNTSVLLVTANKDQYSTEEQNQQLFTAIKSENRVRMVFNSDHLLPSNYVNALAYWF